MESGRSVFRAQEPILHHTCDVCDTGNQVRWYCNQCKEQLCDRCIDGHKLGRATEHDDVVPIEKADRHGDKPVSETCKLHPSHQCDLYCCDCDTPMCVLCVDQLHKKHSYTSFEYEFKTKRRLFHKHKRAISIKIEDFKFLTSTHHNGKYIANKKLDTMRNEINTQRFKLKSEIDSIADALLAEIASLVKDEATRHRIYDQQLKKNIKELTHLLEKAETTDMSRISRFEMESLREALKLYDVNINNVIPKQQNFVTGSVDRLMLTKMFGKLHHENQYEKTDIDSDHVQPLSKFTVTQQDQILDVCPVYNSQTWLSISQHPGLILVNRKGKVKETLGLDFCPNRIVRCGTTDILMTTYPQSTRVYKLALPNKQVTKFADVTPKKATDVSIDKCGHVFVSTGTQSIVVLNQSGTYVREVTCEMDVYYNVCLSSEDVAVSDLNDIFIIRDGSGTTMYRWNGELNNSQQVCDVPFGRMSRDKYDRLFIPDFPNNQVYVLPRDGTPATGLLDQKFGVAAPTAVGVDVFGDVWIGCEDGQVHVLRLKT